MKIILKIILEVTFCLTVWMFVFLMAIAIIPTMKDERHNYVTIEGEDELIEMLNK